MNKLLLPVIFALALGCAASTLAQTPINQANITSFPYYIFTPGSYILTSNLTVTSPGVAAIYVQSPDVTIDLGGYTISGPMNCTSSPTSCSYVANSYGINAGFPGIIVEHGFIKGFASCIFMRNGLVDKVNVSSCWQGLQVQEATIKNTNVTSCSYAGIFAYNSVISDSVAITNGSYGIIAYQSNSINNAAQLNTGVGLYVYDGAFSTNTLISNGTDLQTVGGAVGTKNNACTSGPC